MEKDPEIGHDASTEVPVPTCTLTGPSPAEVPADKLAEPSAAKLQGNIFWDHRPSGDFGTYTPGSYQGTTKAGHTSTFHQNTVYLGKVIDPIAGIFTSRERGIYKFTLENGFEEVSNPEIYLAPHSVNYTLHFGHTWVCDEYLKSAGLSSLIDAMPLSGVERDTLYALIAFKTFAKEWPYRKAYEWYKNDYATILYPKATLYSQSLTNFLKKIGDELCYRHFFNNYISLIQSRYIFNSDIECVDSLMPLLIDSTGLVNSINTPITAPCSHGGPATNQIRLIYIIDYNSGLPVYFRYVAGNVVDKQTLIPSIKLIKSFNLDINMLIMDAGFFSDDNIHDLLDLDISFLLRVPENNTIFSNIVKNTDINILDGNKAIQYNSRYLFVDKVPLQLHGKDCYAYLCYDPTKFQQDMNNFLSKKFGTDNFKEQYDKKFNFFGKFLLLSNKDIPADKIIETYYKRAKIEQIFDSAKNMTGLLPIAVHSEEVIRGHLLISFISSVLVSLLSNQLHKKNICYTDLIYDLSSLLIDIHPDKKHVIHELEKNQREVIEALNLEYPFYVVAGNQRKAEAVKGKTRKGKRGRPKGSKGKEKYKLMPKENLGLNSSESGEEAKRRPGRPPGSMNKPKPMVANDSNPEGSEEAKRKPGRPLGSMNKPKKVHKIKRPYYTRKKN
jgi:hypothetical protein